MEPREEDRGWMRDRKSLTELKKLSWTVCAFLTITKA